MATVTTTTSESWFFEWKLSTSSDWLVHSLISADSINQASAEAFAQQIKTSNPTYNVRLSKMKNDVVQTITALGTY
jgi:hypothetical protein